MKKLKRIVCGVLSVALAISIAHIGSSMNAKADTAGAWSYPDNGAHKISAYTKGNNIYYNKLTDGANSYNPFADFHGFFCSVASYNNILNASKPTPGKNFLYGLMQVNWAYPPIFQNSTVLGIDSYNSTCSTYDHDDAGQIIAKGGTLSDDFLTIYHNYALSQDILKIKGSSDDIIRTLRSIWIEQELFSSFTFSDLGNVDYLKLLDDYKSFGNFHFQVTDNVVNQDLIDAIYEFKLKIDEISHATTKSINLSIDVDSVASYTKNTLVFRPTNTSPIIEVKINGELQRLGSQAEEVGKLICLSSDDSLVEGHQCVKPNGDTYDAYRVKDAPMSTDLYAPEYDELTCPEGVDYPADGPFVQTNANNGTYAQVILCQPLKERITPAVKHHDAVYGGDLKERIDSGKVIERHIMNPTHEQSCDYKDGWGNFIFVNWSGTNYCARHEGSGSNYLWQLVRKAIPSVVEFYEVNNLD